MSRDLPYMSAFDWGGHGQGGKVCSLCPIRAARQQGTTPALLLLYITPLNPSKCCSDGAALDSHHPTFESGFQYQFWSFCAYVHEENNRLVLFPHFLFYSSFFLLSLSFYFRSMLRWLAPMMCSRS